MVEIYVKGRFKDNSIKNFRLARIRAYRNLFMKDISREVGITLSLYDAIESLRCYPTDELRKKYQKSLKKIQTICFLKDLGGIVQKITEK